MSLPLEQPKLGERLRVARLAVGLTQQEAAGALKMARTTLVAIEGGERSVRPDELVAFARIYKTDVHSLLRTSAIHIDLIGQFRQTAAGSRDEKAARQAIQLLHRLATSCVELERKLGRVLKFSYPREHALTKGRLDQQAEDLALDLRNRLGLGTAPIADLVSIAELELGIRVFVAPLPSHICGVFAYHPEIGACVLLNSKHPPTRRAWTLAHELAHFLTSRDVTSVVYDDLSDSDIFEQFADHFAGALLVPGVSMRRAFAEWTDADGKFSARHLILLAYRFHVSIEAICRRLERNGLLPDGTHEALRRKGLNARIVQEVTGAETEPEPSRPSRLALLGVEAYSKGILSEGQLSEMLAVDRVEARRLIDALSDDTNLLGEKQ